MSQARSTLLPPACDAAPMEVDQPKAMPPPAAGGGARHTEDHGGTDAVEDNTTTAAPPAAPDHAPVEEDESMAPAEGIASAPPPAVRASSVTNASGAAAAAVGSIAGSSALAAPSPLASPSGTSAADPSTLVPPAFLRLMQRALASAEHQERDAKERVARTEQIIRHTWARLRATPAVCTCMDDCVPVPLLASEMDSPADAMAKRPRDGRLQSPTAAAAAAAPAASISIPKPPPAVVAFDTLVDTISQGEVDLTALQAHHSASALGATMWTISVQLTNISQRALDGVKLAVMASRASPTTTSNSSSGNAFAAAAPFALTSFTPSVSLPAGRSVCLAVKFPSNNLPLDMRDIPIDVQLSWAESNRWTKSHTISRLSLPRWFGTGQHRLLLNSSLPQEKASMESARPPLIGILDQLHRLDLRLVRGSSTSSRDHSKATAAEESKGEGAASSSSSMLVEDGSPSVDLAKVLQGNCGFVAADPSASHEQGLAAWNAQVMTRWLHQSRQEELTKASRTNRLEDYFIRAPQQLGDEPILAHVTSGLYGPAREALLRFHAHLTPHLTPHGVIAHVDMHSSRDAADARDLRSSMQQTLDAQWEAMKQHLPSIVEKPTAHIQPKQGMLYVQKQLRCEVDAP